MTTEDKLKLPQQKFDRLAPTNTDYKRNKVLQTRIVNYSNGVWVQKKKKKKGTRIFKENKKNYFKNNHY